MVLDGRLEGAVAVAQQHAHASGAATVGLAVARSSLPSLLKSPTASDAGGPARRRSSSPRRTRPGRRPAAR